MIRRRRRGYSWSYTWPQRWRILEDPAPTWRAGLSIFTLAALLVFLTGRLWTGAPWTGFGFAMAGVGLLLTLLTRNSSSRVVWLISVALSAAGLVLALWTFPSSCDADCLSNYA